MNLCLILSIIYAIIRSVSLYTQGPLLSTIEEQLTQKKLSLLTQFVALDWGYNGTQTPSTDAEANSTAVQYLEEVADFAMSDTNLTLTQKINSLKVRHVLQTLSRVILHEEHVQRANVFDNVAESTNGHLNAIDEERYQYEEKLTKILLLFEGQVATDLLIQSFSPPILYMADFHGSDSEYKIEKYLQQMQRHMGAIALLNILLDPPYRINVTQELVATTLPRAVLFQLEDHAAANFGKPPEPPNVEYPITEQSNSQLPKMATTTIAPSGITKSGHSKQNQDTASIVDEKPIVAATGTEPKVAVTTIAPPVATARTIVPPVATTSVHSKQRQDTESVVDQQPVVDTKSTKHQVPTEQSNSQLPKVTPAMIAPSVATTSVHSEQNRDVASVFDGQPVVDPQHPPAHRKTNSQPEIQLVPKKAV